MVIFVFRPDWECDLVSHLVLSIVGHRAERPMARCFNHICQGIATASEHIAEAVEMLSNAWENVAAGLSVLAAALVSSTAALDTCIEDTAAAAVEQAARFLDVSRISCRRAPRD